jgi:hypothetical protein
MWIDPTLSLETVGQVDITNSQTHMPKPRADGRRTKNIVQRERDRLVVSVLTDPVYGCYNRVENELGICDYV